MMSIDEIKKLNEVDETIGAARMAKKYMLLTINGIVDDVILNNENDALYYNTAYDGYDYSKRYLKKDDCDDIFVYDENDELVGALEDCGMDELYDILNTFHI